MDKEILLSMELPKSWAKATISEMISVDGIFVDGDWIESKDQDPNGEVRLIQLADIGDGVFRDKSSRFLTLKRANEIGCTFLRAGDILVARMPDPIGRACIFPLRGEYKFVTAVDVAVIRTGQGSLNNRLLSYFINSPIIRNKIEAHQSGTTRKRISRGNLSLIEFPVPPLPEQNRIVAKLDELLSELEKGKEQLQVALAQLKVYRQAVLKWAFEGRLTNEGVKDGELPEGWKVVELNKVCNKIQDGSHFSPKEQYASPGKNRFKYITAKNIRNDYMDLSNVTYVDEKFHNSIFHRCNPEFGDVLLTKDGVNTGEVTLNTLHEEFSLLSSVCLFKTKREVLLSEFLKYYFQSPLGSRMITGSMTGTAIKRIILGKIKVAEILLPSINEQHSIIEEIKARLSVCEKTGETITQALQQAETLKQSLLQQAFEGKLVPQNPDDEPASALLDRIKRDRENATMLTKSQRLPRLKPHLLSLKEAESNQKPCQAP